jgi:hypothetical protein
MLLEAGAPLNCASGRKVGRAAAALFRLERLASIKNGMDRKG